MKLTHLRVKVAQLCVMLRVINTVLSQAHFINLFSLCLRLNLIGDRGTFAISRAKFINLNTLDLLGNPIEAEGATSLS